MLRLGPYNGARPHRICPCLLQLDAFASAIWPHTGHSPCHAASRRHAPSGGAIRACARLAMSVDFQTSLSHCNEARALQARLAANLKLALPLSICSCNRASAAKLARPCGLSIDRRAGRRAIDQVEHGNATHIARTQPRVNRDRNDLLARHPPEVRERRVRDVKADDLEAALASPQPADDAASREHPHTEAEQLRSHPRPLAEQAERRRFVNAPRGLPTYAFSPTVEWPSARGGFGASTGPRACR